MFQYIIYYHIIKLYSINLHDNFKISPKIHCYLYPNNGKINLTKENIYVHLY